MIDLPIYLAGKPLRTSQRVGITAPGTSRVVGRAGWAQMRHAQQAISLIETGQKKLSELASWQRLVICRNMLDYVTANREKFARCISQEAGKPITTARGEVERALTTFRLAVEESTRVEGFQPTADIDQRSLGYYATVERVPAGPCVFITPFNFPLNLVAHKVAPAMACGCSFILKPSERTPLTSLMLGEGLRRSGLPPESWAILPCDADVARYLTGADRVRVVSFTGSVAVGCDIQRQAVGKKVILELGSNSAVIVEADADVSDAVDRIVPAAFGYAGQSCISVQRIFLHRRIARKAIERLVEKTRQLKVGDPALAATDVGPMIDEAAATRIEKWVASAVEAGAKVLIGGKRTGAYYTPTLLTDVPASAEVVQNEAFGPVAIIDVYSDISDALGEINRSRFGLQLGIFSDQLSLVRGVFRSAQVGAVVVNDVPTTRIDALPYGGVKASGIGREGVRWAIAELTELKTLLVRDKALPRANDPSQTVRKNRKA
ncbi:MAG: aldehyde dehydrogenase family protein [Phycisphaerae bacterium]